MRNELMKDISDLMDDVEKALSPALRFKQIERYLLRMVCIFLLSLETT